jgi:hypothetical protein
VQWLIPVVSTTQEAEIRRIEVWGQPRPKKKKKLVRSHPISTNNPGMVVHICNLSYERGLGRRIVV